MTDTERDRLQALAERWERRIEHLENRVCRTGCDEDQARGLQECVDDLRSYLESAGPERKSPEVSRSAVAPGSAAEWKDLALRLAEEAQVVIDNAHWEVRYGSGDLLGTIKTVRELQRSESTQPPNQQISGKE